ncbi:MAG: hypothetical protein RLZZ324_4 [Candidatus Parcubacteria bacterium]|jgi:hypothetical protein
MTPRSRAIQATLAFLCLVAALAGVGYGLKIGANDPLVLLCYGMIIGAPLLWFIHATDKNKRLP